MPEVHEVYMKLKKKKKKKKIRENLEVHLNWRVSNPCKYEGIFV
jgi:hypothetical protein